MKIIFLIPSLDYGGAERQLITLVKGLSQRGHEVIVTVMYLGGPLENDLKNSGVHLYSLDKKGRWDIGAVIRWVQLVKKLKPDIIHGYLPTPNMLCVAVKAVMPSIPIVWGVRASDIDLKPYGWFVRLAAKVESMLSYFADLIIANSYAGCECTIKCGFPGSRMAVVPNGIDTVRFHHDDEQRRRVRSQWDIGDDRKLVGIVGRLDPMKDHPTFIKMAAILAAKHKDIVFACIGKGSQPYLTQLRELAKQLQVEDCIRWIGPISEMPAVYNALDLLVSTSAYGEGFPNVVGEAMSCGIPCVVTDVGDSAKVVGVTGIAVTPKSPEELAAACEQILDCWEQYSRFTRQRIIEEFSVERLVCRTEEKLLQLVESV